jgi:hypothetical protein
MEVKNVISVIRMNQFTIYFLNVLLQRNNGALFICRSIYAHQRMLRLLFGNWLHGVDKSNIPQIE